MSDDRLKIWLKNNLQSNCLLFLSISAGVGVRMVSDSRGFGEHELVTSMLRRGLPFAGGVGADAGERVMVCTTQIWFGADGS